MNKYPEPHLTVTAQLVGALIFHQIFQTPVQLLSFLDIVLNMLKLPPAAGGGLFVFGLEVRFLLCVYFLYVFVFFLTSYYLNLLVNAFTLQKLKLMLLHYKRLNLPLTFSRKIPCIS